MTATTTTKATTAKAATSKAATSKATARDSTGTPDLAAPPTSPTGPQATRTPPLAAVYPGQTDKDVIQHLDPRTLLIDVNIRYTSQIDRDFIASIRERGVVVPLVAVRTAEGQIRVRFGHRRTLAAIDAGLATVPVLVVADEGTDTENEIDRIVDQWAENEHRTGLTEAEKVGVVQQLTAFGMPAGQIARQTGMRPADIAHRRVVAGSALASKAVERWDFLDLTHAVVIADFEGDNDAVTALIKAARDGDGAFGHEAQRQRDARAERQLRAETAAPVQAAGIRVIDQPAWNATPQPLHRLLTQDGSSITIEDHASCPGHVAWVTTTSVWNGATVRHTPLTGDDDADPRTPATTVANSLAADEHGTPQTDDQASEQDTDTEDADDTEYDDDADDEDEDGSGYRTLAEVEYGCDHPPANGHVTISDFYARQRGATKAADLSDEDRATASAARADVITSNKAWASAQSVRRRFITGWLARKTAPKGTGRFLATALWLDADITASTGTPALAATFLGVTAPAYGRSTDVTRLTDEAAEARTLVLALAIVLAGYEDRTDRNDWRNPRAHTTRYLRFLESQGYTLSTVEKRACGESVAIATTPDPAS